MGLSEKGIAWDILVYVENALTIEQIFYFHAVIVILTEFAEISLQWDCLQMILKCIENSLTFVIDQV